MRRPCRRCVRRFLTGESQGLVIADGALVLVDLKLEVWGQGCRLPPRRLGFVPCVLRLQPRLKLCRQTPNLSIMLCNHLCLHSVQLSLVLRLLPLQLLFQIRPADRLTVARVSRCFVPVNQCVAHEAVERLVTVETCEDALSQLALDPWPVASSAFCIQFCKLRPKQQIGTVKLACVAARVLIMQWNHRHPIGRASHPEEAEDLHNAPQTMSIAAAQYDHQSITSRQIQRQTCQGLVHAFVWTGADTINPKQRLAAFACDGLGPRLQSLPFQRCRIQQGMRNVIRILRPERDINYAIL
mmetsp:Transcript_52031/g.136761  ORF Transcript_52031/g.136761 Transcript_52031/m.136761 type:complete len:298 (-) Transcript_52031:641-1534(-)